MGNVRLGGKIGAQPSASAHPPTRRRWTVTAPGPRRNDVALDLCAIADQEIRGAQLAFDRPKTCAGPLHSMLPTIDMSEPMQEATPAFVVGSDLAQVWSCSATLFSAALTDAFLSFSGTPLFVLINISTSCFRPL